MAVEAGRALDPFLEQIPVVGRFAGALAHFQSIDPRAQA